MKKVLPLVLLFAVLIYELVGPMLQSGRCKRRATSSLWAMMSEIAANVNWNRQKMCSIDKKCAECVFPLENP